MKSIPISIITGFLGSGKTTLLNALLRDPAFGETAVLINEFGDVQVDHDLVSEFSDELITTTTGCLCCTASSDIKQSLYELWRRRKDREIGPVKRVLVETTGLLDPAPLLNSLLTPHAPGLVDNIVKNQFALSQVVTLFDVATGAQSLDRFQEAERQVAVADVLLLTKTDLSLSPTGGDHVRLERWLRSINSGLRILDRTRDWPDVRALFLEPRTYDLSTKGEDVLAWLGAERVHADLHDHAHHHHDDKTRHGEDVRSHVITVEDPIDPSAFRRFLNALKQNANADLLRLKGLVAVGDDPSRPFVVHGVQHLVHPIDRLSDWPNDDRRTKIVVIGRRINVDALRRLLQPSTVVTA